MNRMYLRTNFLKRQSETNFKQVVSLANGFLSQLCALRGWGSSAEACLSSVPADGLGRGSEPQAGGRAMGAQRGSWM